MFQYRVQAASKKLKKPYHVFKPKTKPCFWNKLFVFET